MARYVGQDKHGVSPFCKTSVDIYEVDLSFQAPGNQFFIGFKCITAPCSSLGNYSWTEDGVTANKSVNSATSPAFTNGNPS